ncbi:acyl-CoA dehydrogenase [Pollutimonas nitritireducens]|uniref:Acyl-CoA dehydrogenase n=1 Tax=Pollutimonas nitritireducens TaxID=2045209 RepID=A0A2N4UJV3_9BURK|nr:MaoC family dehydratase N-terminal domain-containing protein [Pollutimonas nitritireducens]PLC55312.1 acyl-CoA dehydrogenase [Pollutimonas nitritireducens]
MTATKELDKHNTTGKIEDWQGRQSTTTEVIEKWPLNGLGSLIDGRSNISAVDSSGAVHPCGHWLYFVPVVAQSEIDADGHPKRGGFIPPLPHARRMWAKSVITYHDDLLVGEQIHKTATISSIERKTGKSGELVFLGINNQYSQEGRILREEEQTIVYRDHQDYDDNIFTLKAKAAADWSFSGKLSSTELFRYSAVTFNGHRIHYDADYTREVEKYPAIIVQGQLIATLVLSHALAAAGVNRCKRFTFKAVKPLFVDRPFLIEGMRLFEGKIEAWAREKDGRVNMLAEIVL